MRNSRLYRRSDTKSDVWWAVWYDQDGNRHRESTKCVDRKAAELWLRDRERRVHDPARQADHPATTIKAAVRTLLETDTNISSATRRMYAMRGRHLDRVFEHKDVFTLVETDVLKYIHLRLEEEKASRNTVNKELITLRRALKAVKASVECLPSFKFRYVPRKRWLTLEEFIELRRRLGNERHRLWLTLACFTGGRYSEICKMAWEDVLWQENKIRIRGTKTDGSDRLVPITPYLRAVLALEWKEGAKGPIAGEWGKINRDLLRACDKTPAIDRVSPNDLRRTYASWMKQGGADSFVVAQMLGHSTSRMVELTYGKLNDKTFFEAAKLLPALPAPTASSSEGPSTDEEK